MGEPDEMENGLPKRGEQSKCTIGTSPWKSNFLIIILCGRHQHPSASFDSLPYRGFWFSDEIVNAISHTRQKEIKRNRNRGPVNLLTAEVASFCPMKWPQNMPFRFNRTTKWTKINNKYTRARKRNLRSCGGCDLLHWPSPGRSAHFDSLEDCYSLMCTLRVLLFVKLRDRRPVRANQPNKSEVNRRTIFWTCLQTDKIQLNQVWEPTGIGRPWAKINCNLSILHWVKQR